MPPSRLKHLPFAEPARLIAYIEQDPALLEAGLRLVARGLPVPGAGPGVGIDLLAVDGRGGVMAIRVVESATSRDVEDCIAIRAWLSANLPTLRSISPALNGTGSEIRIVLMAERFVPAARAILAQMSGRRPETLEVQLFESPSGPAIALRSPEGLGAEAPEAAAPRPRAREAASSDPLSGIALTPAEAEEFRSLAAPSADDYTGEFDRQAPPRPAQPAPGSFLEN